MQLPRARGRGLDSDHTADQLDAKAVDPSGMVTEERTHAPWRLLKEDEDCRSEKRMDEELFISSVAQNWNKP